MKKEIQEILDDIQYDDFYQKTFESSRGYKILVNELNYADNCHGLEDQLGCPLDAYVKIQLGLVDIIYVKRYETVRQYWDENGLQLEQKECLQARPIKRVDRRNFCYQDILGKESMSFSEYGTEFWLKENRSE